MSLGVTDGSSENPSQSYTRRAYWSRTEIRENVQEPGRTILMRRPVPKGGGLCVTAVHGVKCLWLVMSAVSHVACAGFKLD